MARILRYEELAYTELAELPRDKTLLFMVLSPLEVHGPHLPLGTDVMIAEYIMRRVESELAESRPDIIVVEMPSIPLGSDPLPVLGSIEVKPGRLAGLLYDIASSLAQQGFRSLVVFDNHGGPRHQLAIYKASVKAWRKHGFCLLDPFIAVFKMMVKHHPRLMELTGLPPGRCGDDEDMHAGTNETSLMLVARPDSVRPIYRELEPSRIPPHRGSAKLVLRLSSLLQRLGLKGAAEDLRHLANTLSWVNTKPITPYLGAPAEATAGAGERMIQAITKLVLEAIDEILDGKCSIEKPMLSFLSFLALKSLNYGQVSD